MSGGYKCCRQKESKEEQWGGCYNLLKEDFTESVTFNEEPEGGKKEAVYNMGNKQARQGETASVETLKQECA